MDRRTSVIEAMAALFDRLFSPYFMAFICGCLVAYCGFVIYSALGGY